ncbi:pyridoxamine 5'-phosphate oxidase family protein [Jiangella ureilytica]|uniref:Pyridoxamine 5'-phosphate oxidase family protein n=1 Tax=Jiangella ureilytica TaxID=2530374 RepID=A0A4R4RSS4_9ACTN|nr:pyridoxamine 5'-phosphate oxidase family protein [Jiangella ureilytica]TDC53091.1 pyridoxamine 5'-phosphate oxidase family protein [Jiangella ureilytica]
METSIVGEFSDPRAEALPWERALEVIESAQMFWLSTVRRDGRPHVAPLPAMWLEGGLYFCTGAHEQKAKNIEVNRDVVLTTGTNSFTSGIDVVVEGPVTRETSNDRLARLVRLWKDKLGWEFTVGDGVFLDEGNPDHEAVVFALTPAKVLAFTKEPYSQTRYTF